MQPRPLLATEAEPVTFIKEGVDQIISILQDQKYAGAAMKTERRNRVYAIVERKFDFREMSMRTLARHWKDRNPTEQDRFTSLFRQVLENTYITKIETYSGERVVFKKHEVQGDKAIVYSDLVRNNVETPVNYKLRNSGGRWAVYDVEVEGVSLVNNYRTQFASILEKENFDGLLVRLEEKVRKGQAD
ncbi:MAG: MlaC/ttg2D family ABC transporter substrate-binding protein [Thermodesulfobacteriota bacterium]